MDFHGVKLDQPYILDETPIEMALNSGFPLQYFISKGVDLMNCKHLENCYGSKELEDFILSNGGWKSLKHIDCEDKENCKRLPRIKRFCRNLSAFIESGMPIFPNDLISHQYSDHWETVFTHLLQIEKEATEKFIQEYKDDYKNTLLHLTTNRPISEDIFRVIVNCCDVNAVNGRGYTALHQTPSLNFLSIILEKKPNLSIQATGQTPLICYINALGYDSSITKIVTLLLDAGASVKIRDLSGLTAIHYATHFGRTDLLKILLEKGKQEGMDTTNFYYYMASKKIFDEDLFQLFFDFGYELESETPISKDETKESLLILYIKYSKHSESLMKFLLVHGVDVHAKVLGKNCLGFYLEKKTTKLPIFQMLVEYGKFPVNEIVDEKQNTLIHKIIGCDNLLFWVMKTLPPQGIFDVQMSNFLENLFYLENHFTKTIFDFPFRKEINALLLFEWLGWLKIRLLFLAEKTPESVLFEMPSDVMLTIVIYFWNLCFPNFPKQPIRNVKKIQTEEPILDIFG